MVWNGWNIYCICGLLICLYAIYDGNIRYKNGPTKDELANIEKRNMRTFTEDDLVDYRKNVKKSTIYRFLSMCSLVVLMVIQNM